VFVFAGTRVPLRFSREFVSVESDRTGSVQPSNHQPTKNRLEEITMKLSHLLHQREALLHQTRLANLAYAYRRFGDFAARIAGAGLHGKVCLQPLEPGTDRYWPVLTALEGNQSVIEEHFTDEAIMELADLIVFVTGEYGAETTFRLEEMDARFVQPLRRQLVQEGITLEQSPSPDGAPNRRD
jgi:hypothetical protein